MCGGADYSISICAYARARVQSCHIGELPLFPIQAPQLPCTCTWLLTAVSKIRPIDAANRPIKQSEQHCLNVWTEDPIGFKALQHGQNGVEPIMLCPGTILEVAADKDLWITYGFARIPPGPISILDIPAVPNYQAHFKFTRKRFGGTEATFNEDYCLRVRFWKDRTTVPPKLYCSSSRACFERPKGDNGAVVTEANPYFLSTYRYDDKTDPETMACPTKEDGRQSSSEMDLSKLQG